MFPKIDLFEILSKHKFKANLSVFSEVNNYIQGKISAIIINQSDVKRAVTILIQSLKRDWVKTKNTGRERNILRERLKIQHSSILIET